jgi:hypothetical protein
MKSLFSSVLVAALAAATAAYVSRERIASIAAQNALDNLIQHAYHQAFALHSMSGTVSQIPLGRSLVGAYVNLTGDAQEALYGLQERY